MKEQIEKMVNEKIVDLEFQIAAWETLVAALPKMHKDLVEKSKQGMKK